MQKPSKLKEVLKQFVKLKKIHKIWINDSKRKRKFDFLMHEIQNDLDLAGESRCLFSKALSCLFYDASGRKLKIETTEVKKGFNQNFNVSLEICSNKRVLVIRSIERYLSKK